MILNQDRYLRHLQWEYTGIEKRNSQRSKIHLDLLQLNLLPAKFVSDFSRVRSRLRLLIDSKRVCVAFDDRTSPFKLFFVQPNPMEISFPEQT